MSLVEHAAERDAETNKAPVLDDEDSENDDHVPNEYDHDDDFIAKDDQEVDEDRTKKRPREKSTSAPKPKKKRLRRNDRDKEKDDLSSELQDLIQDQNAETVRYDREDSTLERQRPQITNDEDENMDNFIVDSGKGSKARFNGSIDEEAEQIFGDDEEISHELHTSMRSEYEDELLNDRTNDQSRDDGDDANASLLSSTHHLRFDKLQKLFGADVLAERYMTEQDELIRNSDIPERMQVRFLASEASYPLRINVTDQDIDEEALFIYEHVFKSNFLGDASLQNSSSTSSTNPSSSSNDNPVAADSDWDIGASDEPKPSENASSVQPEASSATSDKNDAERASDEHKVKFVAAITNVLKFLHKEHFDVPFIAHYQKESFVPILKCDEDLWTIFEWDEKYFNLKSRKKNIAQLYSKIPNLPDMYNEILHDAQNMDELQDLLSHYQLHYGKAKSHSTSSSTQKLPGRRDPYSHAIKAGLDVMAKRFGMSAQQYAESISTTRTPIIDSEVEPEVEATNFTCREYKTEEQVLKGARHILAYEIAHEPVVRQKLRVGYELSAIFSTSPTPKGEVTNIAGLHTFKNLVDLPITIFYNANGATDRISDFVQILKAERDGFLTLKVGIEDAILDTILSGGYDAYLSDRTSIVVEAWNEQRKLVMKEVKQIMHPQMQSHVKSFLLRKGCEAIGLRCQLRLEHMLMHGPLGHKKTKKINQDDIEEDSNADNKSIKALKCSILACCPPMDQEITAFVMLDKEGEVVSEMHWKLSNYGAPPSKADIPKPVDDMIEKQDAELKQFILKFSPNAIAIATSSLMSIRLHRQISNILARADNADIPIYYVQDDVARIYEQSVRSMREFPDLTPMYKRAISVGRRLRDPLCEIAALFNEQNDLLCLKLHPLQDMLSRDEYKAYLEKALIRVSNNVGVDLNRAIHHGHMQTTMQFIGGLGPRKSEHLIKSILNLPLQTLFKRRHLTPNILGENVFSNCAGFLRVAPYLAASNAADEEDEQSSNNNQQADKHFHVLDGTRIHPNSYELATKMSMDALEGEAENNREIMSNCITLVMQEPEKLEDLDLEAYADELEKRKMGKKHITLKDIKEELENPFADCRETFKPISQDELFYAVIGETEESFNTNKVVNVLINRATDKFASCTLENGLQGSFRCEDLAEEEGSSGKPQVGSVIEAKIEEIDKDNFRVSLTARRSVVEQFKEPEPPKSVNTSNTSGATKRKHRPRSKRNINHKYFHNMNYPEAVKFLRDKSPGDLVIRPSSKGTNHLTITFKFFGDTFINLDIKEGAKVDQNSLSKELFISGNKYEDLDEIIERYVSHVIDQAKTLMSHPKYSDMSVEQIDLELKREKEQAPSAIPYRIGLNKDYPGRFYIHFLPNKRVKRENVTVTPEGYHFAKRTIKDTTKLINAFKRAYKDGARSRDVDRDGPEVSVISSSSSSASRHHQHHSRHASSSLSSSSSRNSGNSHYQQQQQQSTSTTTTTSSEWEL